MKKLFVLFLSGLFLIMLSACNDTSIPSSNLTDPPSPSSSSATDTTSSSMISSGEEEKTLISEIMENELGETKPIEISSIDFDGVEVSNNSTTLNTYTVYFSVGDRKLQSEIAIPENGKKYVFSVSSSENVLHYYYCKAAYSLKELGIEENLITLYDYNTDEQIDLNTLDDETSENSENDIVFEILSEIPSITVDSANDEENRINLNVNLSSEGKDADSIADLFYYDSLLFLSEFLDKSPDNPSKYKGISFNAVVDGKLVGIMLFGYFFGMDLETSFIGTQPIIMMDDTYASAFEAKYEERMYAVDSEKIKESN